MDRKRIKPEDKQRFGGCSHIADQKARISRKRVEEWDGFRKSKKKGGNGRQPGGNSILFDLLMQHQLLALIVVMAEAGGRLLGGAFSALAGFVTGTSGASLPTMTATTSLPAPLPIAREPVAPAPGVPRRTRSQTNATGGQGSGGVQSAIDPKSNYEKIDPHALLARHIMHDFSPPEARTIGTYALTRGVAPEAAKFLFGPYATMTDADMRALRDRLISLSRGGMPVAEAMKTCMPALNAIVDRDAKSRVDFQTPGSENDGDGPGAKKPRKPGEEPDPTLPTPKPFF